MPVYYKSKKEIYKASMYVLLTCMILSRLSTFLSFSRLSKYLRKEIKNLKIKRNVQGSPGNFSIHSRILEKMNDKHKKIFIKTANEENSK